MKIPLNDALKGYYREHSLSQDQLEALVQLQGHYKSGENVNGFLARLRAFSRPKLIAMGTVAGLVMLIALASYLGKNLSEKPKYISLERRLIDEIAYNHNKRMAMEIETTSVDEVQAYLANLDFTLIKSAQLPDTIWELRGGRYCSLQGRLAAQLKLRNKKSGNLYTLYQVPTPPQLESTQGVIEGYSKGTKVKIWTESGLMLGLAGAE